MLLSLKELFIKKLSELERLSTSNDNYSLLQASAILRQLYLDGSPLIGIVNKEFKLKIRIRTTTLSQEIFDILGIDAISMFFLGDDIEADCLIKNPKSIIELSPNDFMRHKVAFVNDTFFTVSDIIKLGAHSGGVHHHIQDEQHKIMSNISNQLSVGGVPCFYRSIRAISKATLKSLTELRKLSLGS